MSKQAFVDLDSALVAIDAFTGLAEEFELSISSDLQDPFGVNIAVITDRILARGWWPEGFEQKMDIGYIVTAPLAERVTSSAFKLTIDMQG